MIDVASNIGFMDVICNRDISDGSITLHGGEFYILDRLSIWLNGQGEAYGVIYDQMHNRIGEIPVRYFSTK